MPGYKLSTKEMLSIAKTYLCCFCHFVLRDPVQTILCGHRFCKMCFDELRRSVSSVCPLDKTVLKDEEVFPDKFAAREILSLSVHCLHCKDGCPWRGEIRHLDTHLDNICVYVKVACINTGCEETLTRAKLPEHLSETCQHRIVACKECNKEVKFSLIMSHVEEECPMTLVQCVQCNQMIQRCKLGEHIDPDLGTCSEVEGLCPFVRSGCKKTQEMKKKDREEHQNSEVVFHVNLLQRQILKLEHRLSHLANEMSLLHTQGELVPRVISLERTLQDIIRDFQQMKTRFSDETNQIRDLNEKVKLGRATEHRVDQVEETLNSVMRQVTDMTSSTNRSNSKVGLYRMPSGDEDQDEDENIKRQLGLAIDMIRRLESRINAQDHMLTLKNIGMADLEERLNDMTVSGHNGILIWRINDFAKRRHDAVTGRQSSFYSAPFYTSKYGYKLCGRTYLNGDGVGKGTHLSLFIVIMRGLYDAILPWPFKQRVTMTLIDQEHRQNKSDYFHPDQSSSSFKKPSTEMNIASGCPMFCPLSELEGRRFVQDDTMFIKLKVDKSNLEEFE